MLALFSIVAGIGLLSFREFQGAFRKNDARNQLDADLRRARNEAIAAGGRTVVTIAADGGSYTVGLDLLPYSTSAVADSNVFRRVLPPAITLSSSAAIIFDPRGYVVSPAGTYTSVTVTFAADGIAYFLGNLYSTGTLSS